MNQQHGDINGQATAPGNWASLPLLLVFLFLGFVWSVYCFPLAMFFFMFYTRYFPRLFFSGYYTEASIAGSIMLGLLCIYYFRTRLIEAVNFRLSSRSMINSWVMVATFLVGECLGTLYLIRTQPYLP